MTRRKAKRILCMSEKSSKTRSREALPLSRRKARKEVREMAWQVGKNEKATLGKLRKLKVGMANCVKCHKENKTRNKKWELVSRFSRISVTWWDEWHQIQFEGQWKMGMWRKPVSRELQQRNYMWKDCHLTEENIIKPVFIILFLRLFLV